MTTVITPQTIVAQGQTKVVTVTVTLPCPTKTLPPPRIVSPQVPPNTGKFFVLNS